ncbi:hypothetical protein LCGC14_0639810 [marine sediment metagenome]|uniref:Uncharacterized protein n=1 Tax=marine sediment metagenome TaxID=412755 RepID=A0A0F9TKW9_9ZZZZ
MQQQQTRPEWAPDNCPPGAVRLIGDEQDLEDLGLRGLASADSAELHQALRQLKWQLGQAAEQGRRRGLLVGFGLGAISVGVAGAAVLLLAIGTVAGWFG